MSGGTARGPGSEPGSSAEATRQDAVRREGLSRRLRRFCWVHGPEDAPGPWAGIVVEWRRTRDGWEAYVVYVVDDEGTPVTVASWVPARYLSAAAGTRA